MQQIIVTTDYAQSFSCPSMILGGCNIYGGYFSLYLSLFAWDNEETETKRPQTKSGFSRLASLGISDDRT